MALRFLSLLASWASLALVAAAAISPTNDTASDPEFVLLAGPKMQDKVADMASLSTGALALTPHGLTGALYLTSTENASNITNGHIAFISCDPDDYPGNLQANNVIDIVASKNASAMLLYSTTANTCTITGESNLNSDVLYTLVDRNASQTILSQLQNTPTNYMYFVNIAHEGSTDGTGDSGSKNSSDSASNPLGPSPSTAVAMIILYSITGVITALFLIIIITGAIRAHRNPDRYGPRDVLGRPRQSRAKGLARAMLDSIPIVKFGENEPAKPTDVEMASHNGEDPHELKDVTMTPAVRDAAPATTEAADSEARRQLPEGIAPAEQAADTQRESAFNPDAQGCTICTEDFEIGQDIRVLPCNHKFHPACVDPWLLNVSGTCPLCRVDLRPTTSDSSGEGEEAGARLSNSFAPPLEEPEHSVDQTSAAQQQDRHANRRRSRLVAIFAPDRLHDSTAEERLAALRRFRERRQGGSESSSTHEHTTPESASTEVGHEDVRRRKRLTMRLHDVFGVRTRRQEEPEAAPATPSHPNPTNDRQ